jgi:PAS domain S-box-containing protein
MDAERFSPVEPWPLQFFELAESILLGLGPDGRVIFINQKGADALGYQVAQAVGRDWFETFLPADVREQARTSFRHVSAGDAAPAESYESRLLCRDGSERIVAWRDAIMRNAAGHVVAGLSAGEDVTERRQAEAALGESEARFRATFEQAPVGMALIGFDGRFLRLNDRLCEIVGYDRADLEVLSLAELTHPEDREADLGRSEALCAGEIAHHTAEQRYLRKDGSVVWVNVTLSLVRDRLGAPDYLVAVVEDISRRREAERLLADADLQRMALAAAGAGAWLWDAGERQQSWSPEIYGIFGLRPEDGPLDLEGWLSRCVHVDDRARFSHSLRRVAADGGGEFQVEYRCVHPALGVRWVRSSGRVICDDTGRPARVYGLSRDVSEQIRAEQALRDSEERLRLAMAAGDIGVWDWDIASGRISWAANGERAGGPGSSGGDDRHALPTTIDAFRASVHPADRQKVRLAIERALASRAQYGVEFRLVDQGGAVRWTEARGVVMRDHAGRPVRMIGIDRDISARKAAEERQGWLMAELDHRARGLLALVQSEVQKTLRAGDGGAAEQLRPPSAEATGRSLGDVVEATSVAEVVAQAMSPYAAERISVGGPLVRLAPMAAEALGIALDELAADAAKSGALACADGLVAVAWSVVEDGEPLLDLVWAEDERRPEASPKRPELARSLLRSRIVADFGGRLSLSFPARGMQAGLRMPLARVAAAVRARPG